MSFSEIVQEGTTDLPFASYMTQKERERRELVAETVLRIYSPSGEEKQLVDFLFRELYEKGLDPRIDGAGNLVCEIGSGPQSLLLCPHLDTVPGVLPVERKGRLLYGRGASDAKGALISMLFAFEDLAVELEQKKRDGQSKTRVTLAAVVEEEKESRGLKQLILDGMRADAAIFGEPCGLNKVTIGYRGHVPVTFEIRTPEAHASAPWITTNAAEVAFRIYEELRSKLSKGSESPKRIEAISVAITRIEAGTAHNVIPGSATMSLDIRVPYGLSTLSVVDTIKEVIARTESEIADCAINFELADSTEPYRTKMNSRIVRAINRSLLKLGVERPAFVSKSGTGDMNTFAKAFNVDAVTYGPGDTRLSHTNSEFVDLDEVFACASVLVKTVKEFSSIED